MCQTIPIVYWCGSGVQFKMPEKMKGEGKRGREGRTEKGRRWSVKAAGRPPRPLGLRLYNRRLERKIERGGSERNAGKGR